MSDSLQFVEIETAPNPDALVIWLHGLGDSGHGFAPIAQALNLPSDYKVRFVFPHAPIRPITINGGMAMPGWYDITDITDLNKRADEEGVRTSAKLISQLIDKELANGISPQRMVLAGFSQGGVMAYHIGTRLPHKIAGIMALSTYLAVPDKLVDEIQTASKQTPIFAAHGTQDDVVPYSAGKMAVNRLSSLGYDIEWQEYSMQHNVCPQEIQHISQWLQKVLVTNG